MTEFDVEREIAALAPCCAAGHPDAADAPSRLGALKQIARLQMLAFLLEQRLREAPDDDRGFETVAGMFCEASNATGVQIGLFRVTRDCEGVA